LNPETYILPKAQPPPPAGGTPFVREGGEERAKHPSP